MKFSKCFYHLMLFFMLPFSGRAQEEIFPRMWTDPEGRQVRASYIDRNTKGTFIRIKVIHGEVLEVPFYSISHEDRSYVVDKSAKRYQSLNMESPGAVFIYGRKTGNKLSFYCSEVVVLDDKVSLKIFVELTGLFPEQKPVYKFRFRSFEFGRVLHFQDRPEKPLQAILDNESIIINGYGGSRGIRSESSIFYVSEEVNEKLVSADNLKFELHGHSYTLSPEQRDGMSLLKKMVEDGALRKLGSEKLLLYTNESKFAEQGLISKPVKVTPYFSFCFHAKSPELKNMYDFDLFGIEFIRTVEGMQFDTGLLELIMDGKSFHAYPKKMMRGGAHSRLTEKLTYGLSYELFKKVAMARIVDVRIDKKVYTLTHEQRKPMRDLLGVTNDENEEM